MCKYGETKIVKYNMNKNPVNVDIAKDLIKTKNEKRKEKRMDT